MYPLWNEMDTSEVWMTDAEIFGMFFMIAITAVIFYYLGAIVEYYRNGQK